MKTVSISTIARAPNKAWCGVKNLALQNTTNIVQFVITVMHAKIGNKYPFMMKLVAVRCLPK